MLTRNFIAPRFFIPLTIRHSDIFTHQSTQHRQKNWRFSQDISSINPTQPFRQHQKLFYILISQNVQCTFNRSHWSNTNRFQRTVIYLRQLNFLPVSPHTKRMNLPSCGHLGIGDYLPIGWWPRGTSHPKEGIRTRPVVGKALDEEGGVVHSEYLTAYAVGKFNQAPDVLPIVVPGPALSW